MSRGCLSLIFSFLSYSLHFLSASSVSCCFFCLSVSSVFSFTYLLTLSEKIQLHFPLSANNSVPRFSPPFLSFVSHLVLQRSSAYRVINLDWEKVLSFCSWLLLLTGMKFAFFHSNMFDVFCDKISLVWVKYFVHNINFKKNKHFQI